MGEGEQEVEERDRSGMDRPVGDHLRRAVEGGDQRRYGNIDKDAHKLCCDHGAEDTETRSLFGALVLFGAQILADESGQRHGETGDGQETETFDFGVGAAARHSHLSEFIDVGLYHYVGESDDGILKSRRQAVGNHLPQQGQVETDAPDTHAVVLRAFAGQPPEA